MAQLEARYWYYQRLFASINIQLFLLFWQFDGDAGEWEDEEDGGDMGMNGEATLQGLLNQFAAAADFPGKEL